VLMLVLGLGILAGCGGEAADVAEPTSTPPPPPTATPLPVGLSAVVWTTSIDPATHEPQDTVTIFPNDAEAIIAAVEVKNVAAGTSLTATWTIDGEPVPDAAMTAETDSTLASGWATFQFTRKEGELFPLGDLAVTVTASDGTSVTGDIDIVVPAT